MANMELDQEAAQLLDSFLKDCHTELGAGSMTTTIYDTAWVSMTSQMVDGTLKWLFPQYFTYLLDTQQYFGSWDEYGQDIDCILNTAAALFSLHKHFEFRDRVSVKSWKELPERISSATKALEESLERGDIGATQHVDFEIRVPSLLELLDGYGKSFAFKSRQTLFEIRAVKMARLDLELFYSQHKTSALHSLEAFVSKLDFDKVGHHKVLGSMMGSPSATAACLIYSSEWDSESESYLRQALQFGSGSGYGSVPSAFPSHLFEICWVRICLRKLMTHTNHPIGGNHSYRRWFQYRSIA
jgi:hypothetical protein